MTIIYFSNNTLLYGANKSLLGMIDNFSDNIHPIVVLPNKGPMFSELRNRNVDVYSIPFYALAHKKEGSIINKVKFSVRYLQYLFINPLILLHLFLRFRTRKINLVHTNTSVLDIGLKLAKFLRVKHVYHIREFQTLDYRLSRFISSNNFYKKLRDSDKVICISKSISEFFPVESEVIYNGVVSNRDFFMDSKCDNFFIVCSTLVPGKGISDAIWAFNSLIEDENFLDFKLLIFGDGEPGFSLKLKGLVRKLGLNEKVLFKGYSSNCLGYMRKATALLMCSRNEGLGRVTIEAMASGCLVIGYNGAGTGELLAHNHTGFLYSSQEELVGYMKEASKGKDKNQSIISAAYYFAKENFTIENYSKRIEVEYQKLLS